MIRLCLAAALLSSVLSANAQFLTKFGRISADNGLPSQSIRAITQSPEGIMWFGLEGGGLARYDSHTFTVYNESSPAGSRLSDDLVETICTDNERNIWVGTAMGLNRLDRDTGVVHQYLHDGEDADSLIGNHVFDVLIDANDRLWVGTNKGLCYLDETRERFIRVPPPAGRAASRIRDLFLDRDNRLWVMSKTEIYSIDLETLSPTLLPYEQNGMEPRDAYCATEDLAGRFWFSTQIGHMLYDPQSGSIRRIPILEDNGQEMEGGGAVAMTDPLGRVWFGTFNEGLIIIEPSSETVTIRHQLAVLGGDRNPLAVRAMITDRDSRIWIGTKHHGLVLHHPSMDTFTHWTNKYLTSSDNPAVEPRSLQVDEAGFAWIGTNLEGIIKFDPATGSIERYAISGSDDRTNCIEFLPNGKLLSGGLEGISEIDRTTREVRFINIRSVTDFQSTPSGEIWVGTENGLFTLNPETLDIRPINRWSTELNEKLSQINCSVLHLDSQGHLWIASNNESVYRLDLAAGSIATIEDLATNATTQIRAGRCFLEGSGGNLWLATKSSGLIRFNPESRQIRRFGPSDGFPTKMMYGVEEDESGVLWISSHQGISRFVPTTGNIISYGTQHGLQANVFKANTNDRAPDGRIYFAGHNGLNSFYPNEIKTKAPKGNLIFTEVRVGNEVRIRDEDSVERLNLKHYENQIMVSFSQLDYSIHGQNQYAYRMSGLNEDWIEIETRQTVSFNYLPPNDYTLSVRAHTPGAGWSEASPIAVLSFSIAKPYWQTWPFRIALLCLVALLLAAIFLTLHFRAKSRQRRLEQVVKERTSDLRDANKKLTDQKEEVEKSRQIIARSRDELEELVTERTRELETAKNHAEESDRLKSSFLANMSHEIRTPMNAILGFSSMIDLDDVSEEERQEYSAIIHNNCNSLLSLIDDILDLSTIEAGQMQIKLELFDLSELFADLQQTLSPLTAEKDQINFELTFFDSSAENQSKMIVSDPVRVGQIILNLATNAIKFTKVGYVSINYNIDREENKFVLIVEDSGIGIAPKHKDHIWGCFRKVEDDANTLFRGTGLGLSITKSLVDLFGGKIEVESELGKGSRFTVTLPLIAELPDGS